MAIQGGRIQKTNKKSQNAKGKGKGKGKGKDKSYVPKPKNPKPNAKEHPAKNDACHHCKEVGHWKRNCPVYLAELMKNKKQVGTASSSGIFTIELFSFPNKSWVYDTGCGTHICITKQGLRGARKLKQGDLYLYVGNGVRAQVEAIGSFDLVLPNGLCFMDYGISVSRNNVLYFNAIPSNGIYEIDMSNFVPNVNSIYNVSNKRVKHNLDSTYLWHCRLAHISKKRIEKLQHDGLLKSTDDESFDQCVSCLSGKMTRKSFPHHPERATDLLSIHHINVCDQLDMCLEKMLAIFTFTDVIVAIAYIYLLKHKHEVFETFKMFKNEVENQLRKTIKSLRSDRRGEYISQEFKDYLKACGISAARILNMVPTKKVDKTPYELWFGKVPNFVYLKVWGCEALVKRDTPGQTLTKIEVSGRAGELEEIQDEDTSPSEITSEIHMEVEGFEPPHEEEAPVRSFYSGVLMTMRYLEYRCKSAFLNGFLVKTLLVQPNGFIDPNIQAKFNTTAGNPVKKILLKLNLSDHRLFKDGGGVKEFQRSFRHSDTERLSRSDEVLKLKNFKKDATLKLSKSTNQESKSHNVLEIAPVAIIDHQLPFEYTIASRSTDVMVMALPVQNINHSAFRSMFERKKFSENNFNDWFCQLKLVLRVEKKIYVIEQPILPAPTADSAANLHRQFKNSTIYEMLLELKSMFEKQARVERFDQIQTFHAWKQEEGKPVGQYVLKMKGYVEQLEYLGYMLPRDLSVGLILNGLTSDFARFMRNYNMHNMWKTIGELYDLLIEYEKGLPKKAVTLQVMVIQGGRIQKTNKKSQNAKGKGIRSKLSLPVLQGLRGSRKLKQGDLYLYVGNGVRAQVEAIRSFDLVLPNGLCFTDYGISVSRNNVLYFNAIPSNGICEIDMSNFVQNVNSIYNVSNKRVKHNLDSTYLWHCRLAHISKKRIEKLQHDGLLKSTDDESFDQCVSCLSGKMTRKSFPHRPERAIDLLGIIHTNVCGPLRHVS
ncbi:retrotransposon protein, putative, ty1-copia subclass [Tanacetum coccineum]